jgi:hypothetical protein
MEYFKHFEKVPVDMAWLKMCVNGELIIWILFLRILRDISQNPYELEAFTDFIHFFYFGPCYFINFDFQKRVLQVEHKYCM